MNPPEPLSPERLFRPCDPALLAFADTRELPDLAAPFGQDRAVEALRFGIEIERPGFNVFALGDSGSGRHGIIHALLQAHAQSRPPADDWCYVNNFDDANRPRLLRMPAGRGAHLKRDMQQFVGELGTALASAFDSDEFRSRVESIQGEFKEREENALQALGREGAEQGVALLRTPQGFAFAPMKGDEAMNPAEFAELPQAERDRLTALMETLHEKLHALLRQFPRWRREMQVRLKRASSEAMTLAVEHLVEELKERYADLPAVLGFLEQVMHDVVEAGEDLRDSQKPDGEMAAALSTGSLSLQRYQVNLLVDQDAMQGAPVVFEDNPTYPNLVGRFDHVAHMGTLVTHFNLIRAGALHRANGGYLLLDASKLLAQPYAYEGLKRALKASQVRIESLAQAYGWMPTLPLEPEPVPLALKVVIYGERIHYYLLKAYDPEFEDLFKVAADFDSDVARSADNTSRYAALVATLGRASGARPLTGGAVARVIEQAARMAGDADRLSTQSRRICQLLLEADHRAGQGGREVVERADVDAALASQRGRAGRIHARLLDMTVRGTLLIDTEGGHVGQVNGLAVTDMGDAPFGHPVRITATVRMGEGDVIDIEREAELGGALHTKGVMILSAFLAARFARSLPLSLSASLVFEQSYGPVEGDSASLAELCALLSALSNAPIRQALAVTGSVNQYGRVQAIGGVNEKIEGFFDLCRARGLSGEQGVLIPESNVQHLMLREDVVQAAGEGKFHIWPVGHVDQAIELLTGIDAGMPDDKGLIPEGSINYRVASQLAEMSLARQAYLQEGKHKARRMKE